MGRLDKAIGWASVLSEHVDALMRSKLRPAGWSSLKNCLAYTLVRHFEIMCPLVRYGGVYEGIWQKQAISLATVSKWTLWCIYVKLVKSGMAVKSDEQLCTNLGETYGHHVSIDLCGVVLFNKVLWIIVGMVQGRHFWTGLWKKLSSVIHKWVSLE